MNMNNAALIKAAFKDIDAFSVTMDVDWASDYVIKKAVTFFQGCQIPLTLFFTHMSPYIHHLIQTERVSYGIQTLFSQAVKGKIRSQLSIIV